MDVATHDDNLLSMDFDAKFVDPAPVSDPFGLTLDCGRIEGRVEVDDGIAYVDISVKPESFTNKQASEVVLDAIVTRHTARYFTLRRAQVHRLAQNISAKKIIWMHPEHS